MTKHYTYKADGNVIVTDYSFIKYCTKKKKTWWWHHMAVQNFMTVHVKVVLSQYQNDDFDTIPSKYLYTTTETVQLQNLKDQEINKYK